MSPAPHSKDSRRHKKFQFAPSANTCLVLFLSACKEDEQYGCHAEPGIADRGRQLTQVTGPMSGYMGVSNLIPRLKSDLGAAEMLYPIG